MEVAGLLDRTFEFVVLRHTEHFKPEAVAAAQRKLKPWLDDQGRLTTGDLA
jgi:hypothetical protein